MPKGMNKVKFEMRGVLYVDMGDFVQEFKNPYDYVPEFVELVKVDGEQYIKGFAPKKKKQNKSREE